MTNEEGALEDLSYDKFKKLYNKWHAILGQTFLGCLQSKEYIHTRAGLILLSRVVNVFPTRPVLGEKIMDALAPLKDDTNRQDLRSMALGYSSQLIKARDEGVWEEDLAAAKARREKKEKEAEERKKAAEKQFQEMQKESDAIDRQLGGGGGRRDWDDRARSAPRGGGPPGGQMKVRHILLCALIQCHTAGKFFSFCNNQQLTYICVLCFSRSTVAIEPKRGKIYTRWRSTTRPSRKRSR